MQFAIAVPKGALAASVGATLDVLTVASRCARALGKPPLTWGVYSTQRQVALSAGMTVPAQPLEEMRNVSNAILVIPGIGLDHPELNAEADIVDRFRDSNIWHRLLLADAHAFAKLASAHHDAGGAVAASCSGVLLLAQAGILDSRTVTTHWRLGGFLQKYFPKVKVDTRQMLVDDKNVISAGAAMAQMDLMLYLIRKQAGREIADMAMKYFLIDCRPTQARYRVWDHLRSDDDDVTSRFETLIETSLPDVPSIGEAARLLNLTHRTLARRIVKATGASPQALIHTVRMRHAHRLLATGSLSLDEIAYRVGYANVSSLRKLTLKMEQTTPASIKRSGRATDQRKPVSEITECL
ncbi:GlxA family transcriptional regulator [Stutzerimonas nitrititolerans]|uniref:GlxA family transcriptional regulator n=1 Tax=Stutzerimonas nitrititolerans TaxID=2482751 RepID=UPI0028B00668|nr:helix-turn-helix domain-containing protein [Stutzerimonas nitrititolerans]